MIQIKNGNLLEAPERIIAHQVNCRGVMGAGLAKQIKDKWYEVYKVYKDACDLIEPHKLLGEAQPVFTMDDKIVYNIFAQLDYGRQKARYTDYDALRKGLEQIKNYAKEKDLNVALPYGIGCGLAGGDWSVVSSIIEEVFSDYKVTLYKFE